MFDDEAHETGWQITENSQISYFTEQNNDDAMTKIVARIWMEEIYPSYNSNRHSTPPPTTIKFKYTTSAGTMCRESIMLLCVLCMFISCYINDGAAVF